MRIVHRWLIACLVVTATASRLGAQTAGGLLPRAAEILQVTGSVDVQRGAGSPWIPASRGLELRQSDRLRTSSYSFAALKFDAGILWQLNAESELNLTEALTGASSSLIVRLERGGAVAHWTPDRRVSNTKVIVQTASGQAAIDGTEWSMRVDGDGRTALAVLEGQVELSNAHGTVTVRQNEAAEMCVGQAPSILRLVSSKDRVQWVASYAASPARYAAASAGEMKAILDETVAAVARGHLSEAVAQLDDALNQRPDADANVSLALVDLLIGAGDFQRARSAAAAGQARHPGDARFDAMASRVALFDGRPDDSRIAAEAATTKDPRAVEGWLSLGDWAIQGGDGTAASRAFTEATRVAPASAPAWFGLGRVGTEREAYADARAALTRALSFDPQGPGYRGELGTLETLANHFERARQEYARALMVNSNDYVALTGSALLELKQGRDAPAVELLLGATLLEPRYAKAHVYLGVAYYRLRRTDDAKKELARASAIDGHDPVPFLMLTQIYSDNFEPALAIRAARDAAARMPYLKSFNQLATTVKGSANLGSAFAALGLEERAQHMAQESHDPFWAGSALFLGDRYRTSFMRESAYGKGIITDPMVFGSSNGFQSLLPRPGFHATASLSSSQLGTSQFVSEPSTVINGYSSFGRGVSYFFAGSDARIDSPDVDSRLTLAAPSYTAALGVGLTPEWALLITSSSDRPHGTLSETDDNGPPQTFPLRFSTTRTEVGLRRRTPSSLFFVGALAFRDDFDMTLDDEAGHLRVPVRTNAARIAGYQSLGSAHTAQWGAEGYRIDGSSTLFYKTLPFHSWLTRGFLSDTFRPAPAVTLQGGVVVTRQGGETSLGGTVVEPRVGMAVRGNGAVLRGSYIGWTKGQESATTAPLTTAGVPLDDRTMQGPGRLKQGTVQLEWELTDRLYAQAAVRHGTQISAYEDNARLLRTLFLRGRDPAMQTGQTLRTSSSVSLGAGLQTQDQGITAEPTIAAWLAVQSMTFTLAGGAANYLLTDRCSLIVRGERWTIHRATAAPLNLVDVSAGLVAVSRRHLFAQAAAGYEGGTLTRQPQTKDAPFNLNVRGWRIRGAFGWESSGKDWSLQLSASAPVRSRDALERATDARSAFATATVTRRF